MPVTTINEIVQVKIPGTPDDQRLADFIELAKFYISEDIFGDKYNYAVALVVCHQLTLDAQSGGSASGPGSGAVGGIKSEKEGQLARSYNGVGSNVSANRQYFMSTQFGQELLQLWNSCLLMPRNRYVSGS